MGVALRAVVTGGALALVVGCAARQPPAEPSQLRVLAKPDTALVYVDEHFVGSAKKLAEAPVALRAGKRRVTIQAEDYFPHDLEIELSPGVSTLDISLRPVPP